MQNDQLTSLIKWLYQIRAIQFGEYQLKSGHKTAVYVNLRKIISYPKLLKLVAEVMWQEIKRSEFQFDLICGVPYTALPIATCISLDQEIPMVMRRREKKDYGTKQMIEGVFQPGQSCLIVEDIVTLGQSIIETAHELENVGLKVTNAIALVNREQGGSQNLHQHHYSLKTIFTLPTILATLQQSNLLSDEELDHANKFLAENLNS